MQLIITHDISCIFMQLTFRTRLGAAIHESVFGGQGRGIVRNELFAPGRTTIMLDPSADDSMESDVPTVLIKSIADCAHLQKVEWVVLLRLRVVLALRECMLVMLMLVMMVLMVVVILVDDGGRACGSCIRDHACSTAMRMLTEVVFRTPAFLIHSHRWSHSLLFLALSRSKKRCK